MARILALDVGERRIGVAISAPEGRLAVPLRILQRRGGEADIEAIAELARAEDAQALVVGLPLSLDGSLGPQARRAQAFARRVAEASGLPLEFQDERLTSVQAKRARPKAKGRRRTPADDVAAAILLQAYLDRHSANAPPEL